MTLNLIVINHVNRCSLTAEFLRIFLSDWRSADNYVDNSQSSISTGLFVL